MIIRKARVEDAPALTDILNEIIEIGGTTAYQTPREAAYFLSLVQTTDPRVFLHVAEADGAVVGLQWIKPNDAPETHIGGIATFAKPGITQRGIGSALFQATKTACRAAQYKIISAVIRGDNSGGLAYYTKMGFVDFSVAKAVPLSDGTPVDRVRKDFTL